MNSTRQPDPTPDFANAEPGSRLAESVASVELAVDKALIVVTEPSTTY